MSAKTNQSALFTLTTVFFFWGFVAASNDILIPVFKEAFDLTQGQSQFVSIAFYISYTVGSLIYMGISLLIGKDLVNKMGYKNGLVLGLVISALGTLLFYPAANSGSYPLIIKFGEEFEEVDEELLIIPHSSYELELGQYVYEFSLLSVPLKRVSPSAESLEEENFSSEEEVEKDKGIDPRWNKLNELITGKKA